MVVREVREVRSYGVLFFSDGSRVLGGRRSLCG